MTTPVTTLDPRYSDPDAVATGWDETSRVLEEAQVFWISTVRSDGRPHVTPCAAVWREGVLYFDTGTTQQKAINLRSNPHVVLTTGCSHWDRGLDVVVRNCQDLWIKVFCAGARLLITTRVMAPDSGIGWESR
jgi:hypothetical protein